MSISKQELIIKVAMVQELEALNAVTPHQLNKLAAEVSREQAENSAEQIKKLEESAPSKGKVLRGAAVGGAIGPVANLAWRAAAGSKARIGQPIYLGARPQVANAVHGAIFGGLVPAGQHKLETEVEKHKLNKYLDEHPKSRLKDAVGG